MIYKNKHFDITPNNIRAICQDIITIYNLNVLENEPIRVTFHQYKMKLEPLPRFKIANNIDSLIHTMTSLVGIYII